MKNSKLNINLNIKTKNSRQLTSSSTSQLKPISARELPTWILLIVFVYLISSDFQPLWLAENPLSQDEITQASIPTEKSHFASYIKTYEHLIKETKSAAGKFWKILMRSGDLSRHPADVESDTGGNC